MDIALKLGQYGMDIDATTFGDISTTLSEDECVIQSCNMLILIKLGELQHHPDIGNDILNQRIKLSAISMIHIADECQTALLQETRVSKVVSCVAVKSKIYGMCDVSYVVITTYGKRLSSNISFNLV